MHISNDITFFTEESNIMDLYFSQKQQFEVKKPLKDGFVYYKNASFRFTRQ